MCDDAEIFMVQDGTFLDVCGLVFYQKFNSLQFCVSIYLYHSKKIENQLCFCLHTKYTQQKKKV